MSELPASIPDIVAIVPAAGIGSRMQCERPKQYLTIGQHTLLEYAIFALLKDPHVVHVVVPIHPQDGYFAQLPIAADPRVSTVPGGALRADSVMAGLQHGAIRQGGWVLVHDAARPCLRQSDLQQLLRVTCRSSVGGILATPVQDTIKQSLAEQTLISQTIDRNNLWHALTPQLFPAALLTESMQRAMQAGVEITDEASALEYCGYQPELVFGSRDNIKVTRPEDLALVRFFLSGDSWEM